MFPRKFLVPEALMLLALLLFAGCAEEDFTINSPADFPGFAENWVSVYGTVSHSTWTTGRFVFTAYPEGSPPAPGGGQRSGSTGGAPSTSFIAGIPKGSGNMYILAFNDVDGSQTPGGAEWQACSGILVIGSENLFGVHLVLASPPPTCP